VQNVRAVITEMFQSVATGLSGATGSSKLGRTEVVFAKRHENGTIIQTAASDYCKLLKEWLLRLDSNQQPSG
jgi:hypothetical protein